MMAFHPLSTFPSKIWITWVVISLVWRWRKTGGHAKNVDVQFSGVARNMEKLWSLWHPASSLAINPFRIILSNKGHIFHRVWLSCHLLWHSKLVEWEFQAALRRPKSLVIKMLRWFVPSEQCLGLLFISVLPLCPFVHDLLELCVWNKKSEFPSFSSYLSIHLGLFLLGWTIWAKHINRGFSKSTSYFFLGK